MIRFALLLALAAAGPALAAGDPVAGKAVYAQCAACHTLDGSPSPLGPSLKGVVGRKAAADETYVYSPPIRRAAVTWTPETLDAFLTDPQAVVPGTKMPFAGLAAQKDRDDLIAYLTQP
jgi:cytochrome c